MNWTAINLQDPEYAALLKRDAAIRTVDQVRYEFDQWSLEAKKQPRDNINNAFRVGAISRRHAEKLEELLKKSELKNGRYIDFSSGIEINAGKSRVQKAIAKVNAQILAKVRIAE